MAPPQSLDQLVKEAPSSSSSSSSSSTTASPPLAQVQDHDHDHDHDQDPPTPTRPTYLQGPGPGVGKSPPQDPLLSLPSSPPQIYLNLLILEASLRAQYLSLRERRRQNTFFLLLLTTWIAYFSYALFLRPREDGSGVGGSIYWMVEMGEKVALMGGVVTALLVWGTGQWERGLRWPRRWLAVANRGLRTMNAKIVVIRGPWWRELLSYVSFVFPVFPSPAGNFRRVERHLVDRHGGSGSSHGGTGGGGGGGGASRHHYHHYYDTTGTYEPGFVEEDLSPGGDYIRLLLLPKSFSPEFRENWDDFRTGFWEKENERRAVLREKLRERDHHLAQLDRGWFWWVGLGWRVSRRKKTTPSTTSTTSGSGSATGFAAASAAPGTPGDSKSRSRRRSSIHRLFGHEQPSSSSSRSNLSRRKIRSESRSSSRSSTPVGGGDERPPSRGGGGGGGGGSGGRLSRRGSLTLTPSSSTGTGTGTPSGLGLDQNQRPRSKRVLPQGLSPLTQAQIREGLQRPPSLVADDVFSAGSGDNNKDGGGGNDDGKGSEDQEAS